MTHDELLIKLTPTLTYSPNLGFGAIPILNSIRAVVELHKPKTFIGEIPLPKELSTVKCEGCKENYPCPTIQAIEKELK
jgi:hypothetical protein